MELTDKNLKLSEIAIDPVNPRNPNAVHRLQNQIIQETLGQKEAKELLRSMSECIRWVNKIVVIPIKEHKVLNPQLTDYNYEGAIYVVIEGNTRLSCLKSNKIEGIDKNSEIPVLIANRSQNETNNQYKESILITQGIANVMVVKEWPQHAKAKHIYDMYLLKKESDTTRLNAVKVISGELGISQNEVRNAIKRYSIFKKVSEDAENLDSHHWGYLEAFDVNQETRSFIGLNEELEWDEDKCSEIIQLIPNLINSAYTQGYSTKKFRDIIRKFIQISNQNDDVHSDIVDTLREVCDSEEDKRFEDLIEGNLDANDLESEWDSYLTKTYSHIQNYPVSSDWANSQSDNFTKVKTQIDKILRLINVANESE